jgi:uncharacterized protein (DUF2147 family)|tara:strand:- start:75 stop:572 length:498 start_codon:yes stop_codon:yes gene_type:complete
MEMTSHRVSVRRGLATVVVVMVLAMGAGLSGIDDLPGDIIGLWDTGDGAHVEMYERDGLYHGKFMHFYEEAPAGGVDAENPDPALRGRSLVGADFILNFTFDGEKWKDGRIYNPENGKQYKADLELKDGVLKVRGWLGVRLLGRTVNWSRLAQDAAESDEALRAR